MKSPLFLLFCPWRKTKYTSAVKVYYPFFLFVLLLAVEFSYSQNPIVSENALTGTPQSQWDAPNGTGIQGFATDISVNKGSKIDFKINIPEAGSAGKSYTTKIYRIGYYQGNGARLVADLGTFTQAAQPAPLYDSETGKTDCNNWTVSVSWNVPATAVSGIYIARLNCSSVTDGASLIVFVVRDDAVNSPILFKTSDATWQAYNAWGGNSFYTASTPVPNFNHATKISYNRPFNNRGNKSFFFHDEYPMIRWLERNGYNVTYATDVDMARDATPFTPSVHKVLLSVGHDEYWSLEERNKFENARNAGVHIAFFSGNEAYWKTRWEDNYKTLVCYKEGTMGEYNCGGKCDSLTGVWTGLWRDGCSPTYPGNDGCRPEGSLTAHMSWTESLGSITVPDTYKKMRFWRNTSIASLSVGQVAVLPNGTLGNEWDPEQFTETYPPRRIRLSTTVQTGLTHHLALYRHSSGALIFSAGTMNWSWGLDGTHDSFLALPSTDMQQATVNLLNDMGIGPGSLQSGLKSSLIPSKAPSSTITSPANGATLTTSPITVTGTSVASSGGVIIGVEVSVDGGNTWQTANGQEQWSYSFNPTGAGTITIKARAWDDLGNLEIPGPVGSSNAISVTYSGAILTSVFKDVEPSTAPQLKNDGGSPLEVGMKFRSTQNGSIAALRYYKMSGTTGTHTGNLWSSSGTLLATATFTNETASGWQQVSLPAPVAITANTTYIVSYFSPSGYYAQHLNYFTQAVINGPLKGLADGEDGGNGIYAYNSTSVFPGNSFGSSNYWADVVFSSNATPPPAQTAPTITTQPTAQTACAGTNATFISAANGSPTPTVQWEVSTDGGTTWNIVTGATSGTLSVSATAANNSYQYRAVWSNSAGSATSASATLTVTAAPVSIIPDAFANNGVGVAANTIYKGYDPAASLTLVANATGGTGLTYTWKDGNRVVGTAQSLVVTSSGTYTVEIKNSNGCIGTSSKTIQQIDVRCKGTLIKICNNGQDQCVNSTQVSAVLNSGAKLGTCAQNIGTSTQATTLLDAQNVRVGQQLLPDQTATKEFVLYAYPNPTKSEFSIKVETSDLQNNIQFRVMDMLGRVIERKDNVLPNTLIKVGQHYRPGLFLIEVKQGQNEKQIKVTKY
jgi:large repetitive protein